MKNTNQKQPTDTRTKRYLMLYNVPNMPGFWTFDGKQYHHFTIENQGFRYLESANELPDNLKAHFHQPHELHAILLDATAALYGVKIVWCNSVDDCHNKEAERVFHHYLQSDICSEKLKESAANDPYHL